MRRYFLPNPTQMSQEGTFFKASGLFRCCDAMACNSNLRFKSPTFDVRRARGRIYYLSQVRRVTLESHHHRSGNFAQPMNVNAFKSVRLTPPPCHPYSRPSIYFDFWSVTVKMPMNRVSYSNHLIRFYLKHSS